MKTNLRSWCRSDENEDNPRTWHQSDENEDNLRTWRQSDEEHSEKLLAEYLRNLNVDQSSECCCVQLLFVLESITTLPEQLNGLPLIEHHMMCSLKQIKRGGKHMDMPYLIAVIRPNHQAYGQINVSA
jgi:hypothetical protein